MTDTAPIPVQRRLHFKIAIFVITTIILSFGLFTTYQLFFYRGELTQMEIQSSRALCETLTSSLEIAMLNGDLESIQYSIDEVTGRAGILQTFLLNMEGRVRASSDKQLIGTVFSVQDDGCRGCHDGGADDTIRNAVTMDDESVLRVATPVVNKPQCYNCHDQSSRFNGILIMDRSLEPVRQNILSNLRLSVMISGISVLLMMLLFRWYINRQVITRVVCLESLARRVAANELDLDIELRGNDELTSLAHSVDNMKRSLRQSILSIDNHRNYLANLLNNLTDGILIIDETGELAFVNRAVQSILGVEMTEVCRRGRLSFDSPPLDRFAQIGDLLSQVVDQKSAIEDVIQVPGADDRPMYLEVHVARLQLPPRLKTETIIVIRDISSRVRTENQVFQSERLATVGRLAAGIAHEINNPMASILTCAEGLLRQAPSGDDAGRNEYLSIIRNSANRCKMITQKLLDYSADSALHMDVVDLEGVLRESLSLLQFEARDKNVEVKVTKRTALPPIKGSKDALSQVFVNLVLNSIQAVGEGARVDVIMDADASSIHVFVNDNGPGINKANLSKIFDPFFTTKPVGVGTGLGLSVSLGIVKRHGGSIEVAAAGEGLTSIKVSFPIDARLSRNPS